MSDFLLIHGAGQGAWSWGKVWGHMTAPAEHPPRLFLARQSVRVRAVDLPGHGADAANDVAMVDMSESVQTVARVAEQEDFRDFTLVGHELGGTVALLAAPELSIKPKRIILVGGIVPGNGRPPASVYPAPVGALIRLCRTLSAFSGRDIPVPIGAINRYWCRGLDNMQQAQTIGHFGPLPLRMLTHPVSLDLGNLPCPVTYVVLGNDRLITPSRQRAMAARIPNATAVELDAAHQVAVQRPRELAETLLAA
ncbi:MAG: alpha/beta hydrolase [Dehalococcoidia bacterium]|nr:alpha/beta hydrolase [Dehalococcoidia bacterium]